ncbi:MAG: hypothetical protein KatS3mg085_305 [Candidatus Dojkabacteria bacterium]|nr:MAG: hypothetical protein KatS3mg085_305 [Candidatus Dojkabacteria bacterium]
MKKIIFITIFYTSVFLDRVNAQEFSYSIPSPTRYQSLEDVVSALGNLIQPIFILTFLAMVLYGAWVRLTSQGNADKLATSRKIIIAAIVGFTLAVLAPSIVNIVTGLLGVTGLETLQTN